VKRNFCWIIKNENPHRTKAEDILLFMNTTIDDIKRLSVAERIQLVEDIWDSIAADASETVQLSEVQKAELHRADQSTFTAAYSSL